MVDIFVEDADIKLKNTYLDGLGITVAQLERHISDEANNQLSLYMQRIRESGGLVDSRYASIEYWLNHLSHVYSSRIEWEIKITREGVLFRISKVLPFERPRSS